MEPLLAKCSGVILSGAKDLKKEEKNYGTGF